ncbi:GrpB family protein [Lacrimispora sp.]|uniref:GrpB family protein n=1 Tax=Lacrimispora sp. TaxID=2719234 RepID=UPI00346048B4
MKSIENAHNFASANDEYLQKVTVGGVKLHNAPITLIEYDPHWPELFNQESNRIQSILGSRVLQLEHVGSTSIPGLCAKPIIDILLTVADSSDEPSYVPALETAGYTLRIREPDWFEHRLFKGPDTDINLHVFSAGASEVKRMLRFRDWLRTNVTDRENYARVKSDLAQHVWRNVQNYADAKTEVIEEIIERINSSEQ